MKVILLQDVRNLGKRHDVKEVKDGYARNFLMPNKLAEPATAGALKNLEGMKAEREKEDAAVRKQMEEVKRQIEGITIEFPLKTDKTGNAFASVNKDSILTALRDHKLITTERVGVELKYPLKEFGDHTVPIDLKKGFVAKLKIRIVKGE